MIGSSCVVLLAVLCITCDAFNILFVPMHFGESHKKSMLPVAEALGRRAAKPALLALVAAQFLAQTLPRLAQPSPWSRPELARSYAWLAAQPRPALLASAEHVRDGWYSSLPNTALPDDADAAGFAADLKRMRVSYVLRQKNIDVGLDADPSSGTRRGLERAFAHLDDATYFKKVHEEPAEDAEIYAPL